MISVKIFVHKKKHKTSDCTCVYFFECPDLNFYNRWDWFFRLKFAKITLDHPKKFVEFYVSSDYQVFKPTDKQKEGYYQAKITKIENAIERYKREYNSLFPIEEDEIYKKLHIKLSQALSHFGERRKRI